MLVEKENSPWIADLPFHRRADPLGENGGHLRVRLGHQHDELVAAVPEGVVGLPQIRPEDSRDLAQGVVAGLVAEGVVDPLEVVEIEHHEGHVPAMATEPLELAVENLLERPIVEQPGERVVVGKGPDFLPVGVIVEEQPDLAGHRSDQPVDEEAVLRGWPASRRRGTPRPGRRGEAVSRSSVGPSRADRNPTRRDTRACFTLNPAAGAWIR